MMSHSQFFALFAAALLVVSCAEHTLYRGGELPPRDAGHDTSPDATEDARPDSDTVVPPDSDPDVVLECGDERAPLDLPPEPIINGTDTFDPSIVELSEGQVLAIGAVMQQVEYEWENVCTATLVTPTVVQTAAHCVLDYYDGTPLAVDQLRFTVGEDAASPRYTFQPVYVWSHPSYDLFSLEADHDVAVLILAEPATVAVPEIEPIPANCENIRRRFIGERLQHVGYGVTDPYDPWPINTRRWWTVETVTDLARGYFEIYGSGETGVCYGDSGGPALWTGDDGSVRVMGVASLAEETCVDYAYFARIDDNCDELEEFYGGCGDVTWAGYCEDNRAVFCDGEALQVVDCGATDRVCQFTDDGLSRCVTPPDPCEGETFTGRCFANAAIWCDDARVFTVECGDLDMVCMLTEDGLYRCADDPCDGISWAGQCVGETAVWCENNRIRQRRCADCLQVCGWSAEHEGYYCID